MREVIVSGSKSYKVRSGRPKVYENAELEALLDQDSFQTQAKQYDGQYSE